MHNSFATLLLRSPIWDLGSDRLCLQSPFPPGVLLLCVRLLVFAPCTLLGVNDSPHRKMHERTRTRGLTSFPPNLNLPGPPHTSPHTLHTKQHTQQPAQQMDYPPKRKAAHVVPLVDDSSKEEEAGTKKARPAQSSLSLSRRVPLTGPPIETATTYDEFQYESTFVSMAPPPVTTRVLLPPAPTLGETLLGREQPVGDVAQLRVFRIANADSARSHDVMLCISAGGMLQMAVPHGHNAAKVYMIARDVIMQLAEHGSCATYRPRRNPANVILPATLSTQKLYDAMLSGAAVSVNKLAPVAKPWINLPADIGNALPSRSLTLDISAVVTVAQSPSQVDQLNNFM